jgi:hypothetical protein
MPHHHVALGVEPGVALRVVLEHARQRRDQERQVGERGGAGRQPAVQVLAQRLELGDVHFLDVGEVRDVALGVRHAVGDHAPHADHADFVGAGAAHEARRRARRRPRTGCSRRRGAAERRVEVLPRDAPARSAAVDLREVEARLAGPAPRGRRGHDAAALHPLSRPAGEGWGEGLESARSWPDPHPALSRWLRERGSGPAQQQLRAPRLEPPPAQARSLPRPHRPQCRTPRVRRRRAPCRPVRR